MSDSFTGRVHTQELTRKYLEIYAGVESEAEMLEALEQAAHRAERNFNLVVAVTQNPNATRYNNYQLKAIRARDADVEETKRAMETMQYWIGQYKESDTNE